MPTKRDFFDLIGLLVFCGAAYYIITLTCVAIHGNACS